MSFKGPLGLWPFPLVNLLLSIGESFAQTKATGIANIEVWEWIDSRGRQRSLTVHRKVE